MKTYQIAQPLDLTGQVCKEPSHYTPAHSAGGGAFQEDAFEQFQAGTPHRWLSLQTVPAGSLLTFDETAGNGPEFIARCSAVGWEA